MEKKGQIVHNTATYGQTDKETKKQVDKQTHRQEKKTKALRNDERGEKVIQMEKKMINCP